jgi:hypothetical protein
MTQHNIIGSERSGAHVVIRRAAPRRRSAFWWARTILEAVVCLAFLAMIWGALS